MVDVPEAGVRIEARLGATDAPPLASREMGATVRAESVTLPLFVRNWQPGDRFQPLGAPGRRKLQDVFVDRKIPRRERENVPIVTDAAGEIVWVAGVAVAERCRIVPSGGRVLLLELRKPR